MAPDDGLTRAQALRLIEEFEKQAEKVTEAMDSTDQMAEQLYGDAVRIPGPEDAYTETAKLTQEWQFTRGWSRGVVWGFLTAATRLRVHLPKE